MRRSTGVVLGASVAVFALALGLILGSGPLRHLVWGSGSSETDALRATVADLTRERDDALAQRDLAAQLSAALAPATVEGMLTGQTVALVVDAGVGEQEQAALVSMLEAAGARVSVTVTLTQAWGDESQSVFRGALAEELVGELREPAPGASTLQLLQAATVQAVIPSAARPPSDADGPVDPTAPSTQSLVLRDILVRAGLVTVTDAAEDPATDPDPDTLPEPSVAVLLGAATVQAEAFVAWGEAFHAVGVATVVTATSPTDRAWVDAGVGARVSVVADASSAAGQALVVLAAREQLAGGAGVYGDPLTTPLVPGVLRDSPGAP